MAFLPGDNSIFDDNDIYYDGKELEYEEIDEEESESESESSSEEEIPEPRKYKEKSFKFTKKPFRGIAMRDHLPAKKAEIEKGKRPDSVLNPLYLKKKADEFIKNKDYYSAITAYNSIEKADPTLLLAISNRIICHMKLFNFEEALADCNMLMSKIENFEEE